jgi:hypothetical protein
MVPGTCITGRSVTDPEKLEAILLAAAEGQTQVMELPRIMYLLQEVRHWICDIAKLLTQLMK